jgi:hypothetical protein
MKSEMIKFVIWMFSVLAFIMLGLLLAVAFMNVGMTYVDVVKAFFSKETVLIVGLSFIVYWGYLAIIYKVK